MLEESLRDIVIRVREGNQDAFTQLYNIYWWKVYHFTKLYITSDYESEEIVQDVFIKLWDSRRTLDETQSIEGYLFMITRNTIFNYNRQSINEESLEMTILSSMEEDSMYNSEDELVASDLKKFIDELIDEMPPQRKKIFQMSRGEGLSNAEIAQNLGITVKAVERSMTLALKFLRDSLAMFIVFEGFC